MNIDKMLSELWELRGDSIERTDDEFREFASDTALAAIGTLKRLKEENEKYLGILARGSISNQQMVIDVDQDKIVDMAEEAYKKFQDYMESNTANMNGSIAVQVAAYVPELLRLHKEQIHRNENLQKELDYSLGMREELSHHLAESNNVLWEQSNL